MVTDRIIVYFSNACAWFYEPQTFLISLQNKIIQFFLKYAKRRANFFHNPSANKNLKIRTQNKDI